MLGPLQPNLHCYVRLSFPNFAVDPSSYCPSPDFHEEKIGEHEAAGVEEVDTGPDVEYDEVDKDPEEVQEMAEEGEGVDPTAAAEEEGEGEIAEVVGGIGIGSSTMNQVPEQAVVENAGVDSGDPP